MDCEERHTVTLRNGVKLTQDGWLETLTRDQVMMIMMIRRRRRKMMMTMMMMMMMIKMLMIEMMTMMMLMMMMLMMMMTMIMLMMTMMMLTMIRTTMMRIMTRWRRRFRPVPQQTCVEGDPGPTYKITTSSSSMATPKASQVSHTDLTSSNSLEDDTGGL